MLSFDYSAPKKPEKGTFNVHSKMAHGNQWKSGKSASNVLIQVNSGPGSSDENSVDVRGGSPLSTIPNISNQSIPLPPIYVV